MRIRRWMNIGMKEDRRLMNIGMNEDTKINEDWNEWGYKD